MRYALENGIKREATKGAKGTCLCCGAEVIAKCGKSRIAHWAHKNNEECSYSMKESKTQWHLDWQNHFPKEWQEVRCTDEQTREIHIADIKTPNGLVVEFQHSAIKPEERSSREQFHKNMIWVIDGRSKIKKFKKIYNSPYRIHKSDLYSIYVMKWAREILSLHWQDLKVMTFLDFQSDKTENVDDEQQKRLQNLVWGFFKIKQDICVVSMPHNCFVDYVKKGNSISEIKQRAADCIDK